MSNVTKKAVEIMRTDRKFNKYSRPEPRSTLLKDIISTNIFARETTLSELSVEPDVLSQIDKFLNGEDNYYTKTPLNEKRLKFTKAFVSLCEIEHNELSNMDQLLDYINPITIKQICSKQDHINFSVNANHYNLLLTLQGYSIEIFNNMFLKKNWSFRDKIDSQYIEYNSPFIREKIRYCNSDKDIQKYYEINEIDIPKWSLELLERFIPTRNIIWCDYHHFTHVSVLETCRLVFEIGLFKFSDMHKLSSTQSKCCQSLKKLIYCWNDYYEKQEDIFKAELDELQKENNTLTEKKITFVDSINYRTGSSITSFKQQNSEVHHFENTRTIDGDDLISLQSLHPLDPKLVKKDNVNAREWKHSEVKKNIERKCKIVAELIAKCKEHIACIMMQMVTLIYDEKFQEKFPSYCKSKLLKYTQEYQQHILTEDMIDNNPFYMEKINMEILEISINFLNENHIVGGVKCFSDSSRKAIDKAFMYVCTAERDVFINSLRLITINDFKIETGYTNVQFSGDSSEQQQRAFDIRNDLLTILEHIGSGGFDSEGNLKISLAKAQRVVRHSNINMEGNTESLYDNHESFYERASIAKNYTKHEKIKQKRSIRKIVPVFRNVQKGLQAELEEKMPDLAGKNQFEVTDSVIQKIKSSFEDYHLHFEQSLTYQSVPLLLISQLDYYHQLQLENHHDIKGIMFLQNKDWYFKIYHFLQDIFEVLTNLLQHNNYAKAQIFKGDGFYHLLSLIKRTNLNAVIMMLKLTDEVNIASYFSNYMFTDYQVVYKKVIKQVVKTFDQDEDNSKEQKDFEDSHMPQMENEVKVTQVTGNNQRKKSTDEMIKDVEESIVKDEDHNSPRLRKIDYNETIEAYQTKGFDEAPDNQNLNAIAQTSIKKAQCKEELDQKSNSPWNIWNKLADKNNQNVKEKKKAHIYPWIGNKDFNPVGYLFQILLNKFYNNLFQKSFLNDRARIRSMLKQQEALFKNISEKIIPICIDILEDEVLNDKEPSEAFQDHHLFNGSSEYDLCLGIMETNLTMTHKKQLQLHVCTSSIRVMNEVCSTVYTRNVLEAMYNPCMDIRRHILETDFNEIRDHVPMGMNAEFTKSLRFFQVVPGAGWLIDRVCDFSRQKFHEDEVTHNMICQLIMKAQEFEENSKDRTIEYLLVGVFPMVYKYVMAFYNQTNFNDKYEANFVQSRLKDLIEVFLDNNEFICKLTSTISHPKNPVDVKWHGSFEICSMTSAKEDRDKPEMANDIKLLCEDIFANLKYYYQGWDGHKRNIEEYQEVNRKQFQHGFVKTCYNEHTDDEVIKDKIDIINGIIGSVKNLKRNYMTVEDDYTGLIHFFQNNKDNLRAIFESQLDRLFEDKDYDMGNLVCKNPAINLYWMSPCISYYFQLLEIMFNAGRFAREAFQTFMEEYEDELQKIRSPNKHRFISTIMKLNSDLMYFLTSKPTMNLVWWTMNQKYVMINKFFKSVCEGNYLPMKEYLGKFIPQSSWDPDFNSERLNIVRFKLVEMNYLLNSSLICENKDSFMLHSDQDRRIIPMITPLIELINELCTGPCIYNINTVVIHQLQEDLLIYNLYIRLIDNISHQWYILKEQIIQFLNTQTESGNRKMISVICKKLPTALLETIIVRQVKKMFLKERIKEGLYHQKDFKDLAKQLSIIRRQIIKKGGRINEDTDIIGDYYKNNPEDSHSDSFLSSKSNTMTKNVSHKVSLKSKMTFFQGTKYKKFDEKDRHLFRAFLGLINDSNWIPEILENSVPIKDWEDLNGYYLNQSDFSDSNLFVIVFETQVLWESMGDFMNNSHRHRLDEIKIADKEHYRHEILDDNEIQSKKTNKKPGHLEIFHFMFTISEKIEIVAHGVLKIYIFPRRPACFMLEQEAKANYMRRCEITDSNKKMTDLMNYFNMFYFQMETDLQNYRGSKFLYKISSRNAFLTYTTITYIISLIMNIPILIQAQNINKHHSESQEQQETSHADHDDYFLGIEPVEHRYIIIACNYLIYIICSWSLILWLFVRYKPKRQEKIQCFQINNPYKDWRSLGWNLKISFYDAFITQTVVFSNVIHILGSQLLDFNILFGAALPLLLIYNLSFPVQNILKAIGKHWDQLLVTLLQSFFSVYIFAVWIMLRYGNVIWADSNVNCSELWNCFAYTMSYGMRYGGGIGENLQILPPSDKNFVEHFFQEMLYFLVINVILLQVIFGIIVDTFSQLRHESETRMKDLVDVCFVCGLNRSEFSKAGKNFDRHINIEHDPWRYLFYIYYLTEKKEDKLNGIEEDCLQRFKRQKVDWLPIGQTAYLGIFFGIQKIRGC